MDGINRLAKLLEGQKDYNITYFQIRNFLEVDLSSFLELKNEKIISKIIGKLNILNRINGECYKYFGRVFLTYNYMPEALCFLKEYTKENEQDPEGHLLLARCCMKQGLFIEAQTAIKRCLWSAPEYYPALNFFKTRENN